MSRGLIIVILIAIALIGGLIRFGHLLPFNIPYISNGSSAPVAEQVVGEEPLLVDPVGNLDPEPLPPAGEEPTPVPVVVEPVPQVPEPTAVVIVDPGVSSGASGGGLWWIFDWIRNQLSIAFTGSPATSSPGVAPASQPQYVAPSSGGGASVGAPPAPASGNGFWYTVRTGETAYCLIHGTTCTKQCNRIFADAAMTMSLDNAQLGNGQQVYCVN